MSGNNWQYAIDAKNLAGCWENLANIGYGMNGGWRGGYEFYRWYISLKTCPRRKYTVLRLTLDKGDGPGVVCIQEI